MNKSKRIILALVILAALTITFLLLTNRSKKTSNEVVEFYVSKLAPQSLAYFDCRSEGMVDGSMCARCEQLYEDTNNRRQELSINTDNQLVEYVKGQNKDCVNAQQGGN